jgi:septum formation protein
MKTETIMRIILASGSPRREMLLGEMGYEFDVVVPSLSEDILPGESPSEHVLRLSLAKAEQVAGHHPEDLIIGADTVVVLDGRILGKPESDNGAVRMLKTLSGRTHTVFTGLSLVNSKFRIKLSKYDSTEVTFNRLSDDEIDSYVRSGEPLDKAGAYGIQGMGSFLVERYDGEIDTVIGFPGKLFERMYGEVISCRQR